MKKVIFVCLLSLSVCLSLPSDPKESAASPPAVSSPNVTGTEAKAETKPEHPAAPPVEKKGTETGVVPAPVTQTPVTNATATNATKAAPASNETSTKTNETKPADKNATDSKPNPDAPAKPAEKKVDPPKDKNDTKPVVPVPMNNGTTPDNKDGKKNDTTTPKGENVSPTVAPVEAKSRAFDGPSFIGGIILTLGLLAIGFMGFKYYKNQTERNYHTL